MDDDVLDELIDIALVLHLVPVLRNGQQGGTKADGQVVRVHHILITVLCQTTYTMPLNEGCTILMKKFHELPVVMYKAVLTG